MTLCTKDVDLVKLCSNDYLFIFVLCLLSNLLYLFNTLNVCKGIKDKCSVKIFPSRADSNIMHLNFGVERESVLFLFYRKHVWYNPCAVKLAPSSYLLLPYYYFH